VSLQVPAVRELLEAEIGLAVAALGTPEPDGGNLPIKYSKEFAVRSDRPNHIASHHMPCEFNYRHIERCPFSMMRVLHLLHVGCLAIRFGCCMTPVALWRRCHQACAMSSQRMWVQSVSSACRRYVHMLRYAQTK